MDASSPNKACRAQDRACSLDTAARPQRSSVTPAKAGVRCLLESKSAGFPALDTGFRRGDEQAKTWFRRKPTVAFAGMTNERKTRSALVAAGMVLLAACSPSSFVQPQGDGGWSPAQRRSQIERAAQPLQDSRDTTARPAATPEIDRLDLETVLRLVRERNQHLVQSERQVAMAAERVREVRGRLLPSTTGSARYTWYSDAQATSVKFPPQLLEQLQLPAAPDVTVRQAEAGVFNGTVLLPLDLSGELRHALRAAQAGYRGEQARQWAATLEQETAAVRAYLQLLEARRLYDVSVQTLAQVRQQLQQTQSKTEQGRVTKNELLVVQVAVRDLEQRLVQRQLGIDQARWVLNQLTGRSIDGATELVDVVRLPSVPQMPELLQSMREHNPLVAALVEEQQRLEETLLALERSRWPRFSGGGAIDYTTADIVQPQRIESGFIGLTLDLGTDLRREAQIAEASAAVEKNRAALQGLLPELETAVRSAHGATTERLQALATAQTAVEQAAENLRIRQQQFENGRIESDKVLEADALLAAQRAGLASALYQAHTRRAELQQLLGLPLAELVSTPMESR